MQTPIFYTPEQVAKIFQVHVQTVASLIKEGHLTGTKVGRQWRITQEGLDEFTKRRTLKAKKQPIN